MQVAFPSSPPAKCIGDDRLTEIPKKLTEGFSKLGFSEEGDEIRKLERSWSKLEESVEFNDEEVRVEDEEEDFSFACVNAEGSPITADEAFEDGQIRSAFPLFNRDLLFDCDNDGESVTEDKSEAMRPPVRKFFMEDREGDEEGEAVAADLAKELLGPYCSWSDGTVAEASPETCRKSNSTGFSKLWRFRDLVLRSNSDGRDAFVFLNNNVGEKTQSSSSSTVASEDDDKKKQTEKKTTKKGKEKTTSEKRTKSAHEKLYMRNRALKEEGKHRSYLPYKQVGFFTNVNGLSRNIHPF